MDPAVRTALARFDFDEVEFDDLRARIARGDVSANTNAVSGPITPVGGDELLPFPSHDVSLREVGRDALASGSVACVVLAGGMATRFGSVVKAAASVFPGRSFLDLKLEGFERTAARANAKLPVLIMTSFATHETIEALVARASFPHLDLRVFSQSASLVMDENGEVFRDAAGAPVLYATGHGDLPRALKRRGELARLAERDVTTLFVSNVDNLAATLDMSLLGLAARKSQLIVEVAARKPGDRGGLLVRVANAPRIVEQARLPVDFEASSMRAFNTNTLWIPRTVLEEAPTLPWSVTRNLSADGTNRVVLRPERIVGELTAYFPSVFVEVPREGTDSRFEPIKDAGDLERKRPVLEALLRARESL